MKRLLFSWLLCTILTAKAVGTNSVSQYSLRADRLLAARIYTLQEVKGVEKQTREAIWEDEEERKICQGIFSVTEKQPASSPACALLLSHFFQVISFERGREEKPLILNNWVLVT